MRVRYPNSTPPHARYFRFSLHEAPARERSDLLERLLARADRADPAADWRDDAFRLIAPSSMPMPGIAACALRAICAASEIGSGTIQSNAIRGGTVFVATPVQYLIETSNVRLTDSGILALRPADAEELAADFNRVWAKGDARLAVTRGARLLCVLDGRFDAATCDPERVRGRHIGEFLPSGPDSARLRRLMSEVEMWLFEHETNRRRAADGVAQVSALWMWGGGAVLDSLPPIEGWAAGDDLFVDAFGLPPPGGEAGIPTVVALAAQPGSAAWSDAESRWLEPAVAELRAGRIGPLLLSAGRRCFRVSAASARRFWRRPKAWWEYFQ